MRMMIVGLSALMLAGCGGEEYAVPETQAYQTLTEVGTSNITPLPGGMYEIGVQFEALPDDSAVQWIFNHNGQDLGRIVATADGNDSATTVSTQWVEGSAPDEGRNAQNRGILQAGVQQLIGEAIDSRFDNRPFDQELRKSIVNSITIATVGGMMNDVSKSMDEHIAKSEASKRESEASAAANPYAATKPSTDLSKF